MDHAARATGARFIEIALIVGRAETLQAFTTRSAAPENDEHRNARELMERSGGIEALGEMHDTFTKLLETRPNVRRIDVVRGDRVDFGARRVSDRNERLTTRPGVLYRRFCDQ